MSQPQATPKTTKSTTSKKFLDDTDDLKPVSTAGLGLDPETAALMESNNAAILKEKASKLTDDKVEKKATAEKAKKNANIKEYINAEDELNRIMDTEQFLEDDEDIELEAQKAFDKPATNLREFDQQIRVAQLSGIESIEATRPVIKYFNRTRYPVEGYFIYQGIKVYETGKQEYADHNDERTIKDILGA